MKLGTRESSRRLQLVETCPRQRDKRIERSGRRVSDSYRVVNKERYLPVTDINLSS
jgi:hypothetical protein